MSPEKITVLIVDDHARVRAAIRIFLELFDDIDVVGEAANGEESIQRVEELLPDVVLTDLVMPVMDGVESSKIITARFPKTHIVILSSSVEHDLEETVRLTGAKRYLLKTDPPDRLAQVIRDVMK